MSLQSLLDEIIESARKKGMNMTQLTQRAGVGINAIRKARKSDDMMVSTLLRLARASGMKLLIEADNPHLDQLKQRNLF